MSSKNKMSRKKALLGILVLTVALSFAIQLRPVKAVEDFLMATQTDDGGAYNIVGVFLANDTYYAGYGNVFNVDQTGYLTEVRVHMKRQGSPDASIGCKVFTQYFAEDYPYNGSSVLVETSTTTIEAGSLSTVETEYTFEFSQTSALTSGNMYSFFIYTIEATLIDSSNYYKLYYESLTDYEAYVYTWYNPTPAWATYPTSALLFNVYANVESLAGGGGEEEYWWTEETIGNFVNLVVILVIVLIPSVILGKLFKLGTYGYATGIVIGAAIGYIFYPSIVPIWLVFAVLIGIIGLMLFGRKQQ